MKISLLSKILGSGFFTGYIPFAPGTFGSLAALIIYLIPGFENLYIIIPAIIVVSLVGIPVCSRFEEFYELKDPPYCTIDEIAGTWISLVLVPKEIMPVMIAFFIWRIMDIIKPYPIRKIEMLKGGLGVMADDIIAGAYSLFFVHLFLLIFG